MGYKIRFTDQVGPRLTQYDTIILDEAHERNLNIDFLLCDLKPLILGGAHPDLKLIIISATIDAERFSRHSTARR